MIRRKVLPLLAAICLSGIFPGTGVQAASEGITDEASAQYTYTVRIYPGNQGTFTNRVRLAVDHTKSGSAIKSRAEIKEDLITVSGLKKDDIITLDLQDGSVRLKEENRYYVKGIRQSGRDNSTVATSVFRVDRDADYVTAYGVQGDMVGYTVNYQDASGNEVLPSDKYYGNVGDKPVVAYKYKEGYEPEVTALAKTLTANEAENVFTFIYSEAERGVITRQVGTPGTTTNTVTEIVPGVPPAALPAGTTAAEAGGGDAGAGEAGAGDTAAGDEEAGGDAAADEGEQEPLQQIGDGEVPLAEQDLKDLDEEEVPASNIQADKVLKKGLPLAASIGIAAGAAAALVALFLVVKKRRKITDAS